MSAPDRSADPRPTISAMLRASAARWPELPCWVEDGREVSYAAFDAQVDRLAAGLLAQGVGKGDHVAVWLPNILEWMLVFCATARIGAVIVPVNTRYKTEEAAYVLGQSDARLLVMTSRMWKADYLAMLAEIAPEMAGQRAGELSLAALPKLRSVLVLDDQAPPGAATLASAMRDDPQAVRKAKAAVAPSDMLLICYTSGSTGAPKGVMHDHGVIEQSTRVGLAMHVEAGDRVMAHMPFYHSAGLYMALITSLSLGAAIVPLVQWDPRRALELIRDHRVTMFGGIPTHYYDLCALPDLDDYDTSSLKAAWIGGSAVMQETFERIMHALRLPRLLSTYGMTENTISTSFNAWDDPVELCCRNKAPLLSRCEVKIVDPETLAERPPGEEGEIWCRGETVMIGYYRNPEATAATITPEGWLRSGDLGVLDTEGYLSITGRLKEMMKIGGTNASPIEIEQRLAAHPAVAASVVVGVPDARMGEVAWAWVQLTAPGAADAAELIAHCARGLADYKVPRHVEFVNEFPLTATGKVQRNVVARMARDQALAG